MKHLLYLIGQPGSGKSTLSAALTAGRRAETTNVPFAHRLIVGPPPVAELGAHRPDGFSGTDALSMSIQPVVVSWLGSAASPGLVLGEGDRLANSKFFEAVLALGYDLQIVRLAVSAKVAAARRSARQLELGTSPQNEAWLKGRVTKNARLADEWHARCHDLNGDQSPERVLAELLALGDPVATALRSGT